MKRIVFISDLHCGHRSGLTPPERQWKEAGDKDQRKYAKVQRLIWDFYSYTIKKLQPIYAVVVNGDAVDGQGERSGGTEEITTDPEVQASMAAQAIKLGNPKKIYLAYGTPYHAGASMDWEKMVVDKTGAEEIRDSIPLDVNNLLFHCRHFVSRSIIPHGRLTAPSREGLWEKLWALDEERPFCHIIVRSHVHYFVYGGDDTQMFVVTPALMAYSKYGVRRCSGIVKVGFVHFDVKNEKEYTWGRWILPAKLLRSSPLKV